ncbi:MAG: LPS-assembly protein LptD, partial [Pseudobdellovibrionaceae bacterium]
MSSLSGLSRIKTVLYFFAILALSNRAFADRVSAKIGDLTVAADNLLLDQDKDFASLRGNVQIIHKGQFLEAAEVDIHRGTRKAYLRGKVVIQDATTRIEGDKVDFDYENSTGIIYNGIVKSGNVAFSGDILHKTKDQEYYVLNADYTTCDNCPPTWSFSGNSIRATIGGYAYIKNSVLRFGGVPFFWLPYLVVPLKSDRQSGLLAPSFETSTSSGLIYSQGFFWAISRNQDATLQITNYELRGLKTGLNYRYVLDQNSAGEFDGAFINDRVFSNESRLNRYRSVEQKGKPFSRWFVKYEHLYELPNDYYFRSQINQASDLQYPRDFETETKNLGDAAMENRASVTHNSKDQHWSFDTSYYVNLLQSNPTASNDNSIHRLPEIRYSKIQQPLFDSSLYYSLDVNYVNFARAGLGYDNLSSIGDGRRYITNNYNAITATPTADGALKCDQNSDCQLSYDGTYDKKSDLIRTGQRLDIRPSIYRPFTMNEYLDFSPKATYRETHYYFNVDENAQNVRRSVLLELGVSSTLSRVYKGELEKSDTYKHEIQPSLNYRRIPWIDHRSHPFFGFTPQSEAPYFTRDNISDADLDSDAGLQFDYNDRVYDRNLVTYGFVNRLIQKRWRNDQAYTNQIASLGIYQSY